MTDEFSFHQDISKLLPEIPKDSIVSRSIFEEEHLKGVLFGFAEGQELSEHTASFPAVLHFFEGEGEVTLGNENLHAQPGTWIHMPANLSHSVKAKTSLVMLLLLLR